MIDRMSNEAAEGKISKAEFTSSLIQAKRMLLRVSIEMLGDEQVMALDMSFLDNAVRASAEADRAAGH